MARRLFYLNEVTRKQGWIRGETAAHIRRVLRASEGDLYELSDGLRFYLGELVRFGREEVEFHLVETREAAASSLSIHLQASLIKFDHFEWLLEKATELGVSRITPVQSLRSEKGLEQAARKRIERWARILRESGQQSRRLKPPDLGETVPFERAVAISGECRIFLDELRTGVPILTAAPDRGSVVLLTGPEGGWDDRERGFALAQGWTKASLGPLILRAETAALAALAALNAKAHAAAEMGRESPG